MLFSSHNLYTLKLAVTTKCTENVKKKKKKKKKKINRDCLIFTSSNKIIQFSVNDNSYYHLIGKFNSAEMRMHSQLAEHWESFKVTALAKCWTCLKIKKKKKKKKKKILRWISKIKLCKMDLRMIYLPKKRGVTGESFVEVYFDLNEIFIASRNNYLPFWPEKDGHSRQWESFNFHFSASELPD